MPAQYVISNWADASSKHTLTARASPDISSGLMAGAERRLARFVAAILAPGYDGGPAGGRVAGFHRPRGSPSWIAGTASCWSGGLRERVDALPRGRDRLGPWPGRLDFQAAPPAAADQAGRGVQHPGAASWARLWPGRRPGPAVSARRAGSARSSRRSATRR